MGAMEKTCFSGQREDQVDQIPASLVAWSLSLYIYYRLEDLGSIVTMCRLLSVASEASIVCNVLLSVPTSHVSYMAQVRKPLVNDRPCGPSYFLGLSLI